MTQTLLKLAADFTVQLTSPVAIGDTTATLTSNVDDDNVALPDGLYGLTIDAGQSNKEYIICTLTGSAVSAVQSVTRQGVATSGFTKAHRRGAKVTITDWAILSRILNNLTGTTGFNSDAPLVYDGAPSSLTGNQFATVNYVLSVVTGGPVTFSTQSLSTQTSGEALAVNDIVYFKESDAKWYKCDADTAATVNDVQIGVNQTTASGADLPVTIVISGPASGFSGLTAGAKYYVSNTAGAISTSAGTTPAFIGYALSTTVILFSPVPYNLPNTGQKQALAGGGYLGTPSSTNKFITETGSTPIKITFTSSGTWTKPAGLKYIDVEIWGGGGGGSGGDDNGNDNGNGGGGGAYNYKRFLASELSTTETVTVGAGGAGGAGSGPGGSGTNGSVGGTTSFGTLLYAYGGGGGALYFSSVVAGAGGGGQLSAGSDSAGGAPRTNTAGSPGYPMVGNGGYGIDNGDGGNINLSQKNGIWGGGAGGDTSVFLNGGNSTYGGGGGGSAVGGAAGVSVFGGNGGVGGNGASVPGGNGAIPAGGGGGGGYSTGSSAGGSGGRGEVRVTEYYS